ncbi:MAG TPA: hypothetical protein QF753_08715 [Victivallales bacterium]|nr:hypothetical protein [Victivallales bacterium]|tara:strand:+ start:1344 stop:1502 length:159 start_codon:yes stop_codon:yes gene_type:complete
MTEEARIYISDIKRKIDNNSETHLVKEIIIIEADNDITNNATINIDDGITYI